MSSPTPLRKPIEAPRLSQVVRALGARAPAPLTDQQREHLWRRVEAKAQTPRSTRLPLALSVVAAVAAGGFLVWWWAREPVSADASSMARLESPPTTNAPAASGSSADLAAGGAASEPEPEPELERSTTVTLAAPKAAPMARSKAPAASPLAVAASPGQASLAPSGPPAPLTELAFSEGARYQRQGNRAVLELGRLEAVVAGAAMELVTPQVTVAASEARFLAEVTAAGTSLFVDEGRVHAREPNGNEQVLVGGQSLRWAASPQLNPERACPRSLALPERRACLLAAAEGEGLGAQNALYALGLLERDQARDSERAIGHWTRYLELHPEGVLVPEATLGRLGERVRLRQFDRAIDESARFLERFPQHPRASEVESLLRRLRQGTGGP